MLLAVLGGDLPVSSHSSGCYIIDSEYNVVNVNAPAKEIYPQLEVGKKCYACLMNLDAPCGACPVANGVQGPTAYVDPIRHITEIVDAVEMDVPGCGHCYGLVFSTVGDEAKFAATLPANAEDLKNLALIKALTVNYYDVFSVDLTDGTMVLYRHNGQPVEADSAYRGLTSYTRGCENYIAKYVYTEDRAEMRQKCSLEYLRAALTVSESITVHYRVFWKDELHYFFRRIARVGDADSFNHIVVGIGCEDVEVHELEQKDVLQVKLQKVEYNSLTGLLTKEAFFIYGSQLLKQHPEQDFDFCILRLDNLAAINHQISRGTGKRTLQLIGRLLKTYESGTSCIAYFGDGTFASLTKGTSTEERTAAVMAFRDEVLRKSETQALSMKWTVYRSISRELTLQETFEKVNDAIITIRSTMIQEYVELNQTIMDQLDWNRAVETNFKNALANGEFVAWYQPKYSTLTQEIIGAEALVRWVRPNGEMVSPGRFIPVLENCGLINELDKEIFRQTCRIQQTIREQGLLKIPISVNLSRASMFKNDIARDYADIAEGFGVHLGTVPIEITESAAVRAIKIRTFADALIEKGFALHMDDFGSGYSSLVSLQTIPFESIKLDKSLVDFIGKKDGENLLKHTIAFAKENGMSVVAEGVETLEQYQFLKEAGCDAIQGYYFSRPVSQADFLQILRESPNNSAAADEPFVCPAGAV